MYFGRYFPGLQITPDVLNEMTPEETHAMRKAGDKLLAGEIKERFNHTAIVARAAGMRMRGL